MIPPRAPEWYIFRSDIIILIDRGLVNSFSGSAENHLLQPFPGSRGWKILSFQEARRARRNGFFPFALLYFFLGISLVYIFLDDGSGEAMQTGVAFLRILAPFYFLVAAKLVSDGVLRGLGKMRQFMTATFTNLILRVVLAFDLSKLWGVTGIWLSWPIGWSVATVMSIFFYRSIWKNRETRVF